MENEHHVFRPTFQVHDTASKLLMRVKSENDEQVHHALLALLMLVKKHPEAAKIEKLHEIITEVLEMHPLDVFLQVAGNRLLDLREDLEKLEIPAFQYPPFQKALPYFPNYGYQVTFVFSDGQLDQKIQGSLEDLMKTLAGKSLYQYYPTIHASQASIH